MEKMRIYAALMLTLALAAGCSSQPKAEAQKPADAKVSSTPAPTVTEQKGPVEVKLTELKIEMPTALSAGATTFKVTNTGSDVHSFEVEGNGIEKELGTKLEAGQTKLLQVNLKPGMYKVYCPVDGHKMIGMSLDLTVT
jgi:uncharacterized cupredoxin-like copper-binding protein